MEKITAFTLILMVIASATVSFAHKDSENYQQTFYNVTAAVRNRIIGSRNSEKLKNNPLDINFRRIIENLVKENILKNLDNSTKCARDIKYVAANLESDWAEKMLDSFGKPGSGILDGNFKMLGEYRECMGVYAPPDMNATDLDTGDFNGKYCKLTSMVVIQIGICIPDSCTSEIQNLMKLINPIVIPPNTTLTFQPDCKPRSRNINSATRGYIALLSFFGILVIVGSSLTVVKYFMVVFTNPRKNSVIINIPIELGDDQNKKGDNRDEDLFSQRSLAPNKIKDFLKKTVPFFECFCVFKNGAKLLSTDTSEGELLCIHAIRFLSMSWVILGHTYTIPNIQIRNLYEALDGVSGLAFQIIVQAFFAVDSFFVLSGFLLTYLCMQQLSKSNGKINWPYFYIHRYLRLTPVYMIVLGFSTTIYMHLGSGPFWASLESDPTCVKYWWWNLLYINNFLPQAKQCMGLSWYLANDMQFFAISPIILISLWRWPKVGYSIIGLLLTVSLIANIWITSHYDLSTGMIGILNGDSSKNIIPEIIGYGVYFDKLYTKPYTRISPYLIGMLLGYILFIRKQSNSPKHSWGFLLVGWIVASTITLPTVYGMYHQQPSLAAACIYNSVSRTVWAVTLCWVIYVCLIDQGGFVNSILSYKLFIPLSRLNYAAYLIHLMIITGYFYNFKTPVEFSHSTMVLTFLGILVSTYALALPVALVLESPFIVLEKVIRKKFSKPQK